MQLSRLLNYLNISYNLKEDIVVSGITLDSRAVQPGDIFVALPGKHVNGSDFVQQAEQKGAVAIFSAQMVPASVPVIMAHDLRPIIARAAQILYPSESVLKVAVTGTNGKTSTVFYVQQLMNQLNISTASIGTIGVRSPVLIQEGHMTTPDSASLNKTLHILDEKGVRLAALEVSSHGLAEDRVYGLNFQAAAFTNLTQDHLDYHHSMTTYFEAKKKLFLSYLSENGTAVLNADIEQYEELKTICDQRGIRVLSYGRKGKELKLLEQHLTPFGQDVCIQVLDKIYHIQLGIMGDFQLMNILAALGLCMSVGAEVDSLMPLLPKLQAPEGRLETAGVLKNGARVYVDYAHTPDALERVLKSLRAHTSGRLICLFGCGGNRDTGKRPIMGNIAYKHADVVYITDDNPRDEDADFIRRSIAASCPNAIIVSDRSQAISEAIAALQSGDILVLAGKGHETGQLIQGVSYAFSDLVEAQLAILRQNEVPLWTARDLSLALSKCIPETADCFGVSIDTRTIKTGDLFIALKGEHLDGHDYVKTAVEKGASLCITDHLIQAVPAKKQVVVENTLDALDALGRFARMRSMALFIGVTGSSGKTTTKEMIKTCLSKQGITYATDGNFNNHIGVPLTLARMPIQTQYAIIEMGMNHAGELMYLSDLVRPNISLITMIGMAHRGAFKTDEEIALAKAEIFSFQSTDGTAVLNKNDVFYSFLADKAVAANIKHILSFGSEERADFQLISETVINGKTHVVARIHGETVSYELSFIGTHFVLNSLAVLAVVDAVGASVVQALTDLSEARPLAGRGAMHVVQLKNNQQIQLIDDAYNANPSSMCASIKTLGLIQAKRRIAVLGDMLELGDISEKAHLDLKKVLEESHIDLLYVTGPLMTRLFETLPMEMRGKAVNNPEQLIPILETELRTGDVVLVKSSHGSGLERVSKGLERGF